MGDFVCMKIAAAISILALAALGSVPAYAGDAVVVEAPSCDLISGVVDSAAASLMREFSIPGLSVGVVANGRIQVFNYGSADLGKGLPVTDSTIFEVGSVSKTFASTLAACACREGRLSLRDKVGTCLPEISGGVFEEVDVLQLATHTSTLPMRFPPEVTDNASMVRYLTSYQPDYAPGSKRQYSNPGIGLLGLVAARSFGEEYRSAVQTRILDPLGMSHTYFEIPEAEKANCAVGYSWDGKPAKGEMDGLLVDEYGGIRTTASDLCRYVRAQLGQADAGEVLRGAIKDTHKSFVQVGSLTQDLTWDQFPYPANVDSLKSGYSMKMMRESIPVDRTLPDGPPATDVLIGKTGSSYGFSAYVAFVPSEGVGIVVLANKSLPLDQRVLFAAGILESVAAMPTAE